MAEKINIGAKEPLYKAAEKLNGAIDEVNTFQTQIDQLVIDGDSSVEAAQARVDGAGNSYGTLKERLDTENQSVTAQLAQIEQDKVDKTEVNGLSNEVNAHKNNSNIHKPIYVFDRLPSDTNEYALNDLMFVFENLLSWNPSVWEKGSIASADGSLTVAENRIRTVDFIEVEPVTSYLVYDATPITIVSTTITFVEYDSAGVFVKTSGWIDDGTVITTAPNTAKVKVVMQNSNSDSNIAVNDPQNISKPVLSQIY
jgi:hypothetical protein